MKDNGSESVDNMITAIHGEWRFDEEVAQNFESHVRKSIPFYEEIQRMIVEMSEWFVRDNTTVYDIGSATGETISRLSCQHYRKNVNFVGIETSEPMVKVARQKCTAPEAHFIHRDAVNVAGFPDASLITVVFTLHFLTRTDRKKLLRKAYQGLIEGGVLIVVDKIQSECPFLEGLWMELYWDFKERQGLDNMMIRQKAKSLRGVLTPLPLSQNINMLKNAGFENVECFFKWYNFAGLIAVKSSVKVPSFPVKERT